MKYAREITLWLFVIIGAVFFGATIYQMMVMVPVFARELPSSLYAFNQSGVRMAVFWTSPLMPIGFVAGLFALTLHWRTPRRNWLAAAILLAVAAEVFTILYFVPRLRTMGFLLNGAPANPDGAFLTRSANEWVRADVWRFWLMLVPSFLCSLKALTVPLSEPRR